ncbi:MAG: MATE family efflux transporter [Planctomycetales bacterium]|nr:MATE family efflux transporter [Planctomycetales bacterium]
MDEPHELNGHAEPAGKGHKFVEAPESLLATIWMALRGDQVNLTTAPLRSAVILMAVPMVLEMVMESVFALVDIFFVSQLGADAVAAVGITESVVTVVFTIAIGLSIGVTALVARRIGEGNDEEAGHCAGQAFVLGTAISIPIGLFVAFQAESLLRIMGAESSVIETGSGYTKVMLGFNVVILLLFLLNAAFRGAGDATIAMRVLWVANGINIVLDPCLIFGWGPFPELGVTGAAVATTIGRGTAVALQLWVLFGSSGRIHVKPSHLRIDFAVMWTLIRLSAAGMFQAFVGMASWIAVIRILASFGSEAVAGHTIGIRIVLFGILPSWGLSNAAATLVGQALGANLPDRAERAAWIACKLNLVFLGALGTVFVVFAPWITGAFGGDDVTQKFATTSLRIVSAGFFFYAYGMVLTSAFNGAGDPWTPTWINIGCFWAFELPAAWLLAVPFGIGPIGVWLAMTIAFSLVAIVAVVLFRKGAWKTRKV